MHKYVIGKRAQKRLEKIVKMGFDHIEILWSNCGKIHIKATGNYIHKDRIEFEDKRDSIQTHSYYSIERATHQLLVLAKKCKEQ